MKQDNSDSIVCYDPSANVSKLNQQSPHSKKQMGHWNEQEHFLYLEFLMVTKAQKAHSRKGQPLFKRMSEIIGTRTPSQCRSHHQKFNPYNPLIKKYKTKKQVLIKDLRLPLLKSKQIMRRYFASRKESIDEE